MFDLGDVALLTVVVALCVYLWRAQGVREIALRAVRRHCDQQELQLLDDSVALRAVWLKRDARGRLRFWRSYNFEFTATGAERYQGRVITLGRAVERILLPPHRYEPPPERLH